MDPYYEDKDVCDRDEGKDGHVETKHLPAQSKPRRSEDGVNNNHTSPRSFVRIPSEDDDEGTRSRSTVVPPI